MEEAALGAVNGAEEEPVCVDLGTGPPGQGGSVLALALPLAAESKQGVIHSSGGP